MCDKKIDPIKQIRVKIYVRGTPTKSFNVELGAEKET